MKDRDVEYFRGVIDARISDLRGHTDATSGSRETVELDQQAVGRLSRMDAIERKAMADATNRLRQTEIVQLTAALKRIEQDDFGYCVDCGEEIERERLNHNPAILKCLDCATG